MAPGSSKSTTVRRREEQPSGPAEKPVADDAAERVADHACEEHGDGEERSDLVQLELLSFLEEGRQPVQVQPERPAVAEVGDGHREMCLISGAHGPVAGCAAGAGEGRELLDLLGRHGAVALRVVAEVRAQDTTQTRLIAPRTKKAPRQLRRIISQTTRGGVMALPARAKAWVTPWAKPRRSLATQYCIARVAVGKVAPSPMPRSSRARKSETRPPARPVRTVATAQTSAAQRQRPPCAEVIAERAPDNLEERIGISEGAERDAELRLARDRTPSGSAAPRSRG